MGYANVFTQIAFLDADIKHEVKVEPDLPLKLGLVGSIADENDSATGTALEGEISDKSDKSDKDQSEQDQDEIGRVEIKPNL